RPDLQTGECPILLAIDSRNSTNETWEGARIRCHLQAVRFVSYCPPKTRRTIVPGCLLSQSAAPGSSPPPTPPPPPPHTKPPFRNRHSQIVGRLDFPGVTDPELG